MRSRPALGLRNQIVALAVVPLVFLILSLVLVLVLARNIELSAILSQRVAQIIKQSDTLSLTIGEMSLSLGQYARSYKSKDLALYDKALATLPDQERELTSLVRGTALEKPAQRYAKGQSTCGGEALRGHAYGCSRAPRGRGAAFDRGCFDQGCRE